MTKVLHLIARDTPVDMWGQLLRLAGPNDRIVSVGPPPEGEDRLTVEAVHVPLGLPRLAARRVARLLPEAPVIHAWSNVAYQAAEAATYGRNATVVYSLPTAPSAPAFRRWRRRHRRLRTIWTVPTQASRQRLVAAGGDAELIHVLPPSGQPIDNHAARRQQARTELGLEADDFALLAPGGMTREANHKMACWIHAIIRYVAPQVRMLMPDPGPQKDSIYYFASGAGFTNEILGPWPASKREDVLAAGDAAVFLAEQDCGVTAMAEAMAAGLPVAAFGTPDLLECAGQAALIAEAHTPRAGSKAVLSLLETPGLADSLRQAGRNRAAEHFTVPLAKTALAGAYETALIAAG